MIKELSYLRENVRLDLEKDGRLSATYQKIVLSKIDTAIRNIRKKELDGSTP
jgi:hypothetical protein